MATVTEIYDHLRLLMARLGEPHCHQCGAPIRQQSPEEIQEELLQLPAGHQGDAAGPDRARAQGGASAKCSPRSARPDSFGPASMASWPTSTIPPELNARKSHRIEAVIDRIVIREGIERSVGRVDPTWRAARRGHADRQPFRARERREQRRPVARSAIQHAVCLPELQNQLRGTRAAHVQLQQPLWRLLRRARGSVRGSNSIRSWSCPT